MDNKEQNETLTRKQLRVIPLIVTSRSLSEGAKRAKIARSTLYRWLEDSNFKAELQRQVRQNIDYALIELRSSFGDAVNEFKRLLRSDNEYIRLRTTIGIHDYIYKFIELEDVEKRLEELEIALQQRQG